MTKCVNLSNIDAAVTCDDRDNVGGVKAFLIFGYWDDVDAFPEFPKPTDSAPLTLEAAGAWVGDVVMKAGTNAYLMEFTDETGELKISDQGEFGGESFKFDLSITSARMRKKIFGFENAVKGRKMFFIVTDANGQSYLMGDKNNAARRVAGEGSTTGAKFADLNKTGMLFTYSCSRKLIYTGDTETLLQTVPTE